MKSMTGFGKAEITKNDYHVSVEMKSVNHRFLDLSLKMPKALGAFEDGIKKTISKLVARGHLDVYMSFENKGAGAYNVEINEALAARYAECAEELAAKLGLASDVGVAFIMKQPDVVSVKVEEAGDALGEAVLECVALAAKGLDAMRTEEGAALRADFVAKLNAVSDLTEKVALRAPEVAKTYAEKLKARIKDYLGEVEPDETRLLTEVALFTDRSSVDEEITRLRAHVEHFHAIIAEKVPVGRKLDFLVQEMNRECNTIGSKANDKVITDYVLSLKTEVEKLREQVQNVE